MPLEMIALAAGLGSRFGGDKQVAGLGPKGELLLELNAYDGIQAGVDSLAWITRPDLVHMLEERAHRVRSSVPVRIEVQPSRLDPSNAHSPHRERPWGTAHAWLTGARPNHPTMVLNADDLYGAEAVRSLAGAMLQTQPADAGMLPRAWLGGYRASDTLSRHGGVSRARIVTDTELRVTGLVELKNVTRDERGDILGVAPSGEHVSLADDTLVSLNLWGFTGDWLPLLKESRRRFLDTLKRDVDAEFGIPDVVFQAISNGLAEAYVVPVRSRWIGVTFPDDRPYAEAALLEEFRSGTYPSPLFPPPTETTNACN